MTNVPSARGYN